MTARTLAMRALAALTALTLVGCSDSAGLDGLPSAEQISAIGHSIADEIEQSAYSLTASDAMQGPAISRRRSASGLSLSASGNVAASDCGVPSQDPIIDSDGDMVPDDLTLTYELPACHYDLGGSTIDLTGALRILDPSPSTAEHAISLSWNAVKVAFSGPQGSGAVTRNGSGTVSIAGSGLSQSHDVVVVGELAGTPTATITSEWSASFIPLDGESIVIGGPLPNGTFTPGGTTTWDRGDEHFSFSVSTPVPLQYSQACVESGTAPFSAGQVHVRFEGPEGAGFVRIRYSACEAAQVTFVAD